MAINRLERSLILDHLAREEEIEVDETSLQSEFGQTLSELQYQGLDLGKVQGGKRGQQQVAEAVAMASANRLITRLTLERMKTIATGEFKPEAQETKPATKKTSTTKTTKKGTSKTKAGQKKKPASTTKKATPKRSKAASNQKSDEGNG